MKKSFLSLLLIFTFTIPAKAFCNPGRSIGDVGRLTTIAVLDVLKPTTIKELQAVVRATKQPISIAGGRYSQGGQIAYPFGTVIDMTGLNKIVSINAKNKKITVQAGAQWKYVQECIDKLDLSVRVMQSYHDFTVGGALSVNVHARDINEGSIIDTVESIKVVLADGSLVVASRQENYELFRAAIGGYGLMGIIVEVTFLLTDNIPLEQRIQHLAVSDIYQVMKDTKKDVNVVFHNIDLFPNEFKEAQSVVWCKTDKDLTNNRRLQNSSWWQSIPEFFVRLFPSFKKTRPKVAQMQVKVEQIKFIPKKVVWRNHEMSYSVKQLSLSSEFISKVTLQEYFVPENKLQQFIGILRDVIKRYDVNVLNLSIRHVRADKQSLLSYARQDSYALVLYIDINGIKKQSHNVEQWSQELIDAVLRMGGTYYLPYLLTATKQQFNKAYPQFKELLKLKKQYDPSAKFKNMLYEKYA